MLSIKKILSTSALALLAGNSSVLGLTIILDFNDPSQANSTDIFSNEVTTFSVTSYGFLEADRNTIYNGILSTVTNHFHSIDLGAVVPAETGKMLDIDFVVGDTGSLPSNGDAEYYVMQIGSAVGGGGLGVAGLSVVRTNTGVADFFGLGVGAIVGSIFTDNINGLSGVGSQLTTGNTTATYNAIAGTVSHEIGHTVSLSHLNKAGSVTPNGLSPLMGTGAIDLPNADRLLNREFAISGFDGQNGNAARFHIAQLIAAIGTRDIPFTDPVPEPSTSLLGMLGLLALSTSRRR